MTSLTLNKKFPLNLIFHDSAENTLSARCFELEVTFYSVPEESTKEAIDRAQLDQNISFAKCQYFIETILDSSWVYDLSTRETLESLMNQDIEMNALLLPSTNEAALITALHAKLVTLCSDSTVIDRVKLLDARDGVVYDFISEGGEPSKALPGAREWLGEFPYWSTPWWNRYDITTYDNFADTEEEHQSWLDVRDFENLIEESSAELNQIDDSIRQSFYASRPQAEVIELEFGKGAKKSD